MTLLPLELLQASELFPFPPSYLSTGASYSSLASFLPSYEHVIELMDSCFACITCFVYPIEYAQVKEEILPLFYDSAYSPIDPSLIREADLHSLGLLFTLCSIGATGNVDEPAPTVESDLFAHLARAALGLRNIFEYGSLPAAQAFLNLGSYSLARGGFGSDLLAWTLMGFGLMIATSVSFPLASSKVVSHSFFLDWSTWVNKSNFLAILVY